MSFSDILKKYNMPNPITIIFYRYENGILTENDGWHDYTKKIVIDRLKRQNEKITYKALIRNVTGEIWHRIDLTKSEYYKKQPKQMKLF